MSNVDEIVSRLAQLTPAEFGQLEEKLPLGIVVRRRSYSPAATPGIERRPGVCGGSACIVRTRIPVWALEGMRRLGVTESGMLDSYPALNAEDLQNAWTYADSHRAEIDEEIRANEEA